MMWISDYNVMLLNICIAQLLCIYSEVLSVQACMVLNVIMHEYVQ